jgi:hypothetical protein
LGFWRVQGRENLSRVKITLLESAGKDKDETKKIKTSLVLGPQASSPA